ncbi:MAG TPA: DUF6766 family protein [Tepidisphaeraceae bacterium]|jgi:hypothetical protein
MAGTKSRRRRSSPSQSARTFPPRWLGRVGRFFRDNSLSIVLFSLFLIFWIGQAIAGWRSYNTDQRDHAQPPVAFLVYLGTGHFLEASAENWESDFLQMAAFIWFTSFLYQKGSPESKDPDTTIPSRHALWHLRRGGWAPKLRHHSLSITFFCIFLISFTLHAVGGARRFSEDQAQHGQLSVSAAGYLLTSRFWFESFQNWQSAFLSTGAMVVLSIFLREKGSPESK